VIRAMTHVAPRLRKHVLALSFLLVGVLVAYPSWAMPEQPSLDDLSHLNAPQRMLLAWLYVHGQLPLWNPYSFAGQPFLAAGQSGPLYLPNLIYLLMPIVPALKLSDLIHAVLCSVGMYLLAWDLTGRRMAACVSALSFTACGFFLGHQIHTQMFDAMAWLPLIFFLNQRNLRRPTPRRAMALAVSLAMEVYAGHPQITFYTLLALILDAVLCLGRTPLRAYSSMVGAMILAFALSAAQWLPTANLVSYSVRTHADASFLLGGSLSPWAPLQWLTSASAGGWYSGKPFSATLYIQLYGLQFWESWCYVGLITFILGVAAIFAGWRRHSAVPRFATGAALTLLLALGANGPLAAALTHLPGFDLFRVPARYLGLCDFYLSLLAAIGLALLESSSPRRWMWRSVSWVSLTAMAALSAARLWGPLAHSPARSFWLPLAVLAVLAVLAALAALRRVAWKRSDTVVAMLANGVWLRPSNVLAGLACIDVVAHAHATSPIVDTPAAPYSTPTPVVRYLQSHLSASPAFPRAASFGATDITHDQGLAYRIPTVNGYDSLEPSWYAQYVDLTWSDATFLAQPRALADALGVQYIVTPANVSNLLPTETLGRQSWSCTLPQLPAGRLSLSIRLSQAPTANSVYGTWFSVTLRSGSNVKTYWVNGWPESEYIVDLPRYWPRRAGTTVTIENQAWNAQYHIDSLALLDGHGERQAWKVDEEFAPKAWEPVFRADGETVWKNPDPIHPAWFTDRPATALLTHGGQARLRDWSINRQVWQVHSERARWLVLSQMYDPNWRADVDGHATMVRRVGRVLTGIRVPSGVHTVTMTYRPTSFLLGAGISAASAIGCLMLLALRAARHRRLAMSRPHYTSLGSHCLLLGHLASVICIFSDLLWRMTPSVT
jgi:hypothetical protein